MSEDGEPPSDLVDNLTQALLAEDVTKQGFYRQELETSTQLSRRVNLHWQAIRWLTLKYKVATRAFGLSLVPDWEAQTSEIQSTLSKVYEDLFFDYEDLVTGLPQASLTGPGSYQVRRQTILAGRLGQYPNYPEPQLAEKLKTAALELIDAGYVDHLYVDATGGGEAVRFYLSPAEQYGTDGDSPAGESP
jgi:hypothetical protein